MKVEYCPEKVRPLVVAMSQVLNDMQKDSTSLGLFTKAQARIAYEPFAEPDEKADIMPLEEAQRIIEELS
jgi:phage terminase small subunit